MSHLCFPSKRSAIHAGAYQLLSAPSSLATFFNHFIYFPFTFIIPHHRHLL